MNTPTRLGAFALGLAVVFSAAVGVGNAVGPVGTAAEEPHGGSEQSHGGGHTGTAVESGAPVKGLSVSQDGYTLVLEAASLPAGELTDFAFTIAGPDSRPLTAYTPTHDKDLHLIVVRRDGTGFQHVHPEPDAGGQWSVPLTLEDAGDYKVYADFAPGGQDDALTLAADLQVAGDYEPTPLPPVSRTALVDGYTVTLDGELVAGQESELVLSVSRAGAPVTDLQPYLAAYGHLVALRAGDLAYLHTHPDGEPGDGRTTPGPEITFGVDVPTAGDYRLYLDFQHEGVVRTAEFTATTEQEGS